MKSHETPGDESEVNFDYELQSLHTNALSLEYYYVPWDSELIGRPVSQLQHVQIRDFDSARVDFAVYADWKHDLGISFSTAKIPHHSFKESRLIQIHGYRFIELNFRPRISLAAGEFTADSEFRFENAADSDRSVLCGIASSIFRDTRFHLDPSLGKSLGDQRYACWMQNAFDQPHQQAVKCLRDNEIVAFFVQETPEPDHVFWSLVGLAPGLQGRGLGTRIWVNALHWLQNLGISRVSTSISSLNLPVINLYARLGFQFPEPDMVFHWHRRAQDA